MIRYVDDNLAAQFILYIFSPNFIHEKGLATGKLKEDLVGPPLVRWYLQSDYPVPETINLV